MRLVGLGRDACRRRERRLRAHTLVEVITVVLILSILACVAVPRLNLAAVTGTKTDGVLHRITTDLRRARANAIQQAAWNSKGFALVMTGGEPYTGFEIVDLSDSTVAASADIPDDVCCSGGERFEFSPLGDLRGDSDMGLRIAGDSKTYLLTIVPATGAVKWTRCTN